MIANAPCMPGARRPSTAAEPDLMINSDRCRGALLDLGCPPALWIYFGT
jgi:hypothetical protein